MLKTTNSKLIYGLAATGAAGILTGLFLAPKAGKELRSDLEEKARTILDDTRRKAGEFKRDTDHRISEVHQKACRALNC